MGHRISCDHDAMGHTHSNLTTALWHIYSSFHFAGKENTTQRLSNNISALVFGNAAVTNQPQHINGLAHTHKFISCSHNSSM